MDQAGVLPGFQGVAVHDGWSSYGRYQQATHARCNAHHLRELAGGAALPGQRAWTTGMAALLIEAKWAVGRAVAAGADRLDPRRLDHYHARYQTIIDEGWRANPPPAATRPSRGRHRPPSGRQRRSKAANLLARLDDHHEEVLRFTTDFRVPFDNNQAERDIRMAKLQQKISGGWRTLAGAQRFCRPRSYGAPPRHVRAPRPQAAGRRAGRAAPGVRGRPLATGRRRPVTPQPRMGHADDHEQPRPPPPASPRRGAATHPPPTPPRGGAC